MAQGPQPVNAQDSNETRRAAAKRTAWWVASIAIGVYAMFIYMGARGQ